MNFCMTIGTIPTCIELPEPLGAELVSGSWEILQLSACRDPAAAISALHEHLY